MNSKFKKGFNENQTETSKNIPLCEDLDHYRIKIIKNLRVILR